VAEVRLRIADAPDDRQPLGLPELLEADQGGVEAQLIVEPPYVFLRDDHVLIPSRWATASTREGIAPSSGDRSA